MTQFWMIRAGEGSRLAGEFEQKGYVGIGWNNLGDFSALTTLDAVRRRVDEKNPNDAAGTRIISAGQVHKFRNLLAPGDRVITYDGERREYLLGTINGKYEYRPGLLAQFDHIRRTNWEGRVPRDVLRESSKNTLG